KGDFDTAVQALKAGRRLDASHFGSLMLLGHSLLEQARHDRQKADAALLVYQGCIGQRPTYAQAYFQQALANTLLGRTAEAEKDFAQAKKLGSNYQRTFLLQGDAYAALCQWDKAAGEYTKLVELSSANEGLLERGRAYVLAHKWDKALADYSQAAE